MVIHDLLRGLCDNVDSDTRGVDREMSSARNTKDEPDEQYDEAAQVRQQLKKWEMSITTKAQILKAGGVLAYAGTSTADLSG